LTGFKWLGTKGEALIKTGHTLLLAYEEAIGNHGQFVNDIAAKS